MKLTNVFQIDFGAQVAKNLFQNKNFDRRLLVTNRALVYLQG